MEKLATALLMLLMVIGTKAQINVSETTVQAPKMNAQEAGLIYTQKLGDILGNYIVYPESAIAARQEGVVKIAFRVKRDGSIDSFRVLQSVSASCDQQVISALKMTNNRWIPGRINNDPVDMETTVSVLFDLVDIPSKEERALALYDNSINKFHRANNPLLTPGKKHRKLESTIKTLDKALKLTSNYPCILYVKTMVYEAMDEKDKAQEMVSVIDAMLATNMDAKEALATIRAAK